MLASDKVTYDIDLAKPHANQDLILKDNSRFRVVACGRRFGKTELSKIAVTLRLFKGQHVWFCSPTNENSKRVFRYFISLFKNWDESLVKINKTDMRIDLLFNGGWVEFKSLAEPDNLRGEGLNFIVIDEAAFVLDHVFDEILLPMLLSDKGEVLLISSTNGRNWFWHKYNFGMNEKYKDWVSYRFTTYDNPLLAKEDIDNIREITPDTVFRREYLAEFEEDGGTVFKGLSNVVRKLEDTPFESEHDFVEWKLDNKSDYIIFGVDWGQVNDYTVITVLDSETKEVIEYSRLNNLTWSDIREEIKRLNDKWKPFLIAAEENNATANIEELSRDGLPVVGYMTTVKSKPEFINKLALAIENKEISLPDDEEMINELSAYSISRTKSGKLKYEAPSGMHDDIVMSLAIAYDKIEDILPSEAFSIITI